MLGRLLHITLNTFSDTQTPAFKMSENKIVHINVSCRYNGPGAFVKRWQTAGRAENNAANKRSSQIIVQTLFTHELVAFSKRVNVLLKHDVWSFRHLRLCPEQVLFWVWIVISQSLTLTHHLLYNLLLPVVAAKTDFKWHKIASFYFLVVPLKLFLRLYV